MNENEMTGANGAPSLSMSKVTSQIYTDMQALIGAPSLKKVPQDSLPSHRNSRR